MGSQNAALDEIQFSHPGALEYWQGVHKDSVHPYLTESPFFDHTSKNGVLWGQAINDGNTMALYADRQRLEQTLQSRPGIEYMIVGEPQPQSDPAVGPDTGIWVVRKQEREKRGSKEDDLTTLGTYYIAGQNMYQAPSVYDVLGNHLLSAMTSLGKFMDEASSLPHFSPAQGYSWFPPRTSTTPQKVASSQFSRETSVAPENSTSQQDSSTEPSARSSSLLDSQQTQNSSSVKGHNDAYLLEQSLHLAQTYADEFMDENPLRGEPGKFVFTYSKDHLRSRQAQAEAAAAKAKEREAAEKAKTATPAAFSTKAKESATTVAAQKRKGSKAEAKRRRKSRPAISPTSPSATASPAQIASPRVS